MNNTSESDRALQNHNRQKRNAKEIFLVSCKLCFILVSVDFFSLWSFGRREQVFLALRTLLGQLDMQITCCLTCISCMLCVGFFFPKKSLITHRQMRRTKFNISPSVRKPRAEIVYEKWYFTREGYVICRAVV